MGGARPRRRLPWRSRRVTKSRRRSCLMIRSGSGSRIPRSHALRTRSYIVPERTVRERRQDRRDQGRRHRRRLPERAARRSTTRSRSTSLPDGARGSWRRCSSTWATAACGRSRWTRPTACPRPRGGRHRRPDHGAGRRGDAGPDLQRARRDDRQGRPDRGGRALADPPRAADVRQLSPDHRDLRDRDQGDRPAGAVREGRQGRPVRRRRRRQDGADPGADQQHRPGARRPLGVRGRGRAHAARATTSSSR